ncbi:MAG TPA: SRPBCC domain-containing protein [Polyangiales bacterium]|jgi:uncharacterized protein YndB with AHSA1/START domain|nr:SRPBCC domain-containing protein [Polyangiales bacterium]
MPDILHRIEVKASPKNTYEVLSSRQGLADWWTSDTQGDFNVGGVIKFRFGTLGGFDMKVLELEPAKRVLWEVVGGPEDWIGTKVSFDLAKNKDFTTILFKHQGWKEPVEFMHHCSTKWAIYLMSIKSLIETGKGAAFPNDPHITGYQD